MSSSDEKKIQKFVNSLGCSYILSVLAACNAELVTYPLDMIKTRLQIQGEIAYKKGLKSQYRGMFGIAVGVAREEGFFRLWQGISAMFVRHSIYSGLRIITYHYMREEFFGIEKNQPFDLWKASICGLTAGVIAQFVANPADLIKVHMQMEGRRRLMGEPPRVKGLIDAFSQVYKVGGIPGLWKGTVPSVIRSGAVNLGDLTAYDLSKRLILQHSDLKDGPLVHIIASFIAGTFSAAISSPADVLKSRIMNQPIDKSGRPMFYMNTWDCLTKTVNKEGFFALYKGIFPYWLRLTPWALVFWVSYEQFRNILGAISF